MKAKEYFGDWLKVIDIQELRNIVTWLGSLDKSLICPSTSNIFKAFRLCPYKDCKVVILGQDPYPQPGVAQGLVFANSVDTPEDKLSPSLQIIKEAVINYEINHNPITFDNTLESWAKQGILLINSALTCQVNIIGSHVAKWRPFIAKLIYNICQNNTGIIFVLFGKQAQSFKQYINKFQYIIECEHPAYFARINEKMPYTLFTDINKLLKGLNGTEITFYKEKYVEYMH